jgi:hypothetical protein
VHYQNENEIEDLISAFINKTLPKEKWTHEAHLTAALWHLVKHDYLEAVCLIKSRIISYNLSTGGENTSMRGYHETITIFWMKLISLYLEKNKDKSLLEITNSFLSSPLAVRSIIDHFYTKELWTSYESRAIYIPSDKAELDHESIRQLLISKAN